MRQQREDQNNNRFIMSNTTTLDMFHRNSTPVGFAYIQRQSKWVGKITIKTERMQIFFSSDDLIAVASLDLKVPSN